MLHRDHLSVAVFSLIILTENTTNMGCDRKTLQQVIRTTGAVNLALVVLVKGGEVPVQSPGDTTRQNKPQLPPGRRCRCRQGYGRSLPSDLSTRKPLGNPLVTKWVKSDNACVVSRLELMNGIFIQRTAVFVLCKCVYRLAIILTWTMMKPLFS